jgi:hypothetical protein
MTPSDGALERSRCTTPDQVGVLAALEFLRHGRSLLFRSMSDIAASIGRAAR